jgi:hypothetical protein
MRTITTYERFHRHIAAFFDGDIDSLLALGRGGIGKSHAYKAGLRSRPYHLFGGRQSPLQVYTTLYDAPHLPVVLDDISSLLRDDNFRDMLKALCETGRKVVRWGTTTPKLQGRAQSFICTSPVLIVLNKMSARDPDLEAILDRVDAIRFEPTKREVIDRMREVFPANENLIDLLAELPAMPSLRTLVKARCWQKSKHLNLIEELLAECGVPPAVAHLAEIIAACPENEWCSRYMADTGLTDRTYRRHKALALQLVECHASANTCPNVRGGLATLSTDVATVEG